MIIASVMGSVFTRHSQKARAGDKTTGHMTNTPVNFFTEMELRYCARVIEGPLSQCGMSPSE